MGVEEGRVSGTQVGPLAMRDRGENRCRCQLPAMRKMLQQQDGQPSRGREKTTRKKIRLPAKRKKDTVKSFWIWLLELMASGSAHLDGWLLYP